MFDDIHNPTPERLQAAQMLAEGKSLSQVVRATGISQSAAGRLRKSLNRTRPATDTFQKGAAAGFDMRHAWIKRDAEGQIVGTSEFYKADTEAAMELLTHAVEALCEPIKPIPPIECKADTEADLLAVYPMGDPHFGCYAWAEEAGENFDLEEAESRTKAAVDNLVSRTACAERGLLINLGDFFHADNEDARTPASGHALDVDTRHSKVMQVGIRAMVHCIEMLLNKHEQVEVWNVRGNHDPNTSMMLALCLQAWFRENPRVKIPINPSLFSYYRFGRVLIGSHHGHGARMNELPAIMAYDRKEDWGVTDYRYWYCGHIHHKQSKETPGVIVETFNTLAANDAWHAGKGYRAASNMQSILHHKDHGEIERHTCSLSLIGGAS